MNAKRQKRFRDREKERKLNETLINLDSSEEDEGSPASTALTISVPIVIPPRKPNWYDPLFWNDIVLAVSRAEFNTRKAVRDLQANSSDGRFATLSHSTIEGWFDRTKDDSGNIGILWKESLKVLARESMHIGGSGRQGILNAYPEIGELIVEMLKGLRATGSIVNGSVARVLIVGVLQAKLPSILLENGGVFKVSTTWVSSFCARNLGWVQQPRSSLLITICKGT
jgi:hypothetical protein